MLCETRLGLGNVGESESLPSKQHVPEDYNKEADSVKRACDSAERLSELNRNPTFHPLRLEIGNPWSDCM
jgi:hypothetical protein